MADRKSIEAARAAWRRLLAQLRSVPIADARKLVDEMDADLGALFPPPAPPQRAGAVVDMFDWLRRPQRGGRT